MEKFTGYDGSKYTVGDRVEVHPDTDLWIRGVKFGSVVSCRSTPNDRVHVKMDALPTMTFAGSEDTFRLTTVAKQSVGASRRAMIGGKGSEENGVSKRGKQQPARKKRAGEDDDER